MKTTNLFHNLMSQGPLYEWFTSRGHKYLFFHPTFSSSTNECKSWIQYMMKYILSISLEYWKIFLSFNSQVGKVLFSGPKLTCGHLCPPEPTSAHLCPPVLTWHMQVPGFQFLSQGRIFLCSLAVLELANYVDQASFELIKIHLPLPPECWKIKACINTLFKNLILTSCTQAVQWFRI